MQSLRLNLLCKGQLLWLPRKLRLLRHRDRRSTQESSLGPVIEDCGDVNTGRGHGKLFGKAHWGADRTERWLTFKLYPFSRGSSEDSNSDGSGASFSVACRLEDTEAENDRPDPAEQDARADSLEDANEEVVSNLVLSSLDDSSDKSTTAWGEDVDDEDHEGASLVNLDNGLVVHFLELVHSFSW